MSGVKVDRQGKASALKEMIRETKATLHDGHNLVIFPQGTRVPVGAGVDKYPYQVGIAALYLACNVPVVPARLNSGRFWAKGFMIRRSGTIKMEFLEPILPGLKREEFMAKIEELLEKEPS